MQIVFVFLGVKFYSISGEHHGLHTEKTEHQRTAQPEIGSSARPRADRKSWSAVKPCPA